MESTTINQTLFDNMTDSNDTVDWAYWQSMRITIGKKTLHGCSFASLVFLNKSYMMLHPWSDVEPVDSLCEAKRTLATVVLIVVIVTGIPGNLLSILTIRTLPKSTGAFYVSLLSGSDLVAIIARGIDTALNRYRAHNVVSCKVLRMFVNYTGMYANWVLVLICFERFFSIKFPLKKSYYFTLKRARKSALLPAAFLLPFVLVYLWIMDESENKCSMKDSLGQFWVHMESTLYSYLPAVLLIVMVVAIAMELKKLQKARKSIFTSSERSAAAQSNAMTQKRLKDEARVERCLTMMLLFAAITFIILTLPICIVNYLFHLKDPTPRLYAQLELAYETALALTFMSHAINFFIYFISTGRFRTQLFALLRCPSHNQGRDAQEAMTAQTQEYCL